LKYGKGGGVVVSEYVNDAFPQFVGRIGKIGVDGIIPGNLAAA